MEVEEDFLDHAPVGDERDDGASATAGAAQNVLSKHALKQGGPIQAGLAVAGGIAGLIAWYLSVDWRWLAGSLALVAN